MVQSSSQKNAKKVQMNLATTPRNGIHPKPLTLTELYQIDFDRGSEGTYTKFL